MFEDITCACVPWLRSCDVLLCFVVVWCCVAFCDVGLCVGVMYWDVLLCSGGSAKQNTNTFSHPPLVEVSTFPDMQVATYLAHIRSRAEHALGHVQRQSHGA